MLDQRLLLSLPLASKTNQNNRRGGLTMTKKKTLKNWLLTITFSCIVICFIDLLFHQRLDRMFIIAWSISYTLFYFIRNREIIFKKSNQDWSIYIKKQRLRNCMKISCAICLFFLWQCRPKSVAQPAMRLVSPGFGQTLSEKLIYNLFFLWYNFIKNSKGYSSFAFWPVCRRITRSFLFRFYRYYFWVR